jgi:hypothetical protein
LEYRLSDLISKLRIPVPVDIAFNDDKQLSSEFLKAIEAAESGLTRPPPKLQLKLYSGLSNGSDERTDDANFAR